MNIAARVRDALSEHDGRPAVSVHAPGRAADPLTYRELGAAIAEVSAGLARCGVQPGDLVPCYMTKSSGLVAALLAAMCSGGVACCLNNKLKPQQALRMTALAGARHLVLDRGSWQALRRMERGADGLPGPSVVPLPAGKASGSGLYLLRIPAGPSGAARWPSTTGGPMARPAFCLFTSGSTGAQKGVLISAADLAERSATEADCFGLRESDTLLSLLPFSFDVGLNQLLSCLLSGAHLVAMNSWFPKDIRTAIKTRFITGISGVPSIWVEMMSAFPEGFLPKDAPRLRYLTVSGGDLSPSQLENLRTACSSIDVFKTYGQTETFRSSLLLPEDFSRKITSVGRPVPGTAVSVVDESGNPVPAGTEGEIVHRGAGTMLAYLNDPEETRRKLREGDAVSAEGRDGTRAVYTGDRGRLDSEGHLYIHGRADGMIKTAGHRVYPKEVEDCIVKHPGVKRAAVLGLPDPRKGQSILAAIVARSSVSAEEVLGYLRAELPSYMVPDRLEVVDGLPVSENGKVQYAAIRERHEKARVL